MTMAPLPTVLPAVGVLAAWGDADAGPGATFMFVVLASGLFLAPVVMFGLGIACAAGSRRRRRTGAA